MMYQEAATSMPLEELNKRILSFHQSKASIPEGKTKDMKALVTKVSRDLQDKLKEKDQGVKQFHHAGSAYDGLQVANSPYMDFDIPLEMNGRERLLKENVTPGYVRFRPRNDDDPLFKGCLDFKGFLLPEKIQQSKMFSMVQRAGNELNAEYASRGEGTCLKNPRLNGPAIKQELSDGRSTVHTDIVPSFEVNDDIRYVAKPFKEYAEVQPRLPVGVDPKTLWRESHSLKEKEIFNNCDAGNGCRREVLRVLKAMRNEDATLQGLSSYHLKTIMLYEMKKYPRVTDWSQDKRSQRFLGILESMRDFMAPGRRLPNYFIQDLDLLEGISQVTRENIRGRIQHLLNSRSRMAQALN